MILKTIFHLSLVVLVLSCLNHLVCAKNINRDQLSIIKMKMNTSVNPCENYHQYACGKWSALHRGNEYYETIGFIDYKINQYFVEVFKDMKKISSAAPLFFKKALNLYTSCEKLTSFDPLNFLILFEQQENIPVRDYFTEKSKNLKCDWIKLVAAMRKYDLNGVLIEELVVQDPEDSLNSIIDVDMPVLNGGLKPLKYTEFVIIMDYLNMTDSNQGDSFWEQIANFENYIKSLENEMAEVDANEDYDIEANESESTSPFRNLRYYHSLKPNFIKKYLNALLGSQMKPMMRISIQHEAYLKILNDGLVEADDQFLCRYLIVRFLWHLHMTTPNSFSKVDCAAFTRSALPLAMQYIYENRKPEVMDSYSDVEEIFGNLIEQFNRTLEQNANHFDEEVMDFLRSKLSTKKVKVGNLPRSNTIRELENIYSPLDIRKDNYFWNHLAILKFSFKNHHNLLFKRLVNTKVDFYHLQDRDTGANSSPYYLGRFNTVVVPSTLLNPPIYHPNFEQVYKYSSLGFLLAHEIVHGFDLSGIMFDQDGNIQGPSEYIFRNNVFNANLNCLQKRSSKVIDEKIADVSGLRVSYHYFFDNMSNAEKKSKSASSEFTMQELFFLSFAQFFCGTVETDYSESLADHGSDQQRLIDALANFDQFSEVYKCPVGSPMNPATKCHLWR